MHIISSRAIDQVVRTGTREHEDRVGGPLLWLQQYFRTQPFRVRTTQSRRPGRVRIELRSGFERGQVTQRPSLMKVKKFEKADAFVISTLMNEFDLHRLSDLQGLRCVDLQGYVRAEKVKGKKRLIIAPRIAKLLDVVKTTAHESRWIPKATLEIFKQHILLITRGARPLRVYVQGKSFTITPRRISAPNTLGAGDTFFAAFVAAFLKTHDAHRSATFAVRAAEHFLRLKKSLRSRSTTKR